MKCICHLSHFWFVTANEVVNILEHEEPFPVHDVSKNGCGALHARITIIMAVTELDNIKFVIKREPYELNMYRVKLMMSEACSQLILYKRHLPCNNTTLLKITSTTKNVGTNSVDQYVLQWIQSLTDHNEPCGQLRSTISLVLWALMSSVGYIRNIDIFSLVECSFAEYHYVYICPCVWHAVWQICVVNCASTQLKRQGEEDI